jgi:hypothetical protein
MMGRAHLGTVPPKGEDLHASQSPGDAGQVFPLASIGKAINPKAPLIPPVIPAIVDDSQGAGGVGVSSRESIAT